MHGPKLAILIGAVSLLALSVGALAYHYALVSTQYVRLIVAG